MTKIADFFSPYHVKDCQREHQGVKVSLSSTISGEDKKRRNVANEAH
jgi:hypothetical protein